MFTNHIFLTCFHKMLSFLAYQSSIRAQIMLCIRVMPNTYAGCDFFTRTGEGFPLMTSASCWLSIVSRIFETKMQSSAAEFSCPLCSFRKGFF